MATKTGTDSTKALDLALSQIERAHGKGSIQRFGERVNPDGMPVIGSGCLSLDYALGVFGFPRGRIIEIFGPESSGKTTLALHAVAQAQKEGGVAAYIDAEHAMDPVYTKKLGVDLDQLLISQPDSGEQALDIAETLVRSNAVDIVVIDSVAALVPRAEIDGEIGDSHVGVMARMMSQAMRKLTGAIHQSNGIVVFINQIREKIGVMFGSNETTPGGRALKFYSSVRLDVRRIGQIKDGGETIGNRVRVRVVKNKVAAPFRQAEFDMLFNEGISAAGDLVDLGVLHKIIEKSGAWFSYQGERLGQGRENTKRFLNDNPDIAREVREKVMEKLGATPKKKEAPAEEKTSAQEKAATEK